jgi:hypothetical protein
MGLNPKYLYPPVAGLLGMENLLNKNEIAAIAVREL